MTKPNETERILREIDYNAPNVWCKVLHPHDGEAFCRRIPGHEGDHGTRDGYDLLCWAPSPDERHFQTGLPSQDNLAVHVHRAAPTPGYPLNPAAN